MMRVILLFRTLALLLLAVRPATQAPLVISSAAGFRMETPPGWAWSGLDHLGAVSFTRGDLELFLLPVEPTQLSA